MNYVNLHEINQKIQQRIIYLTARIEQLNKALRNAPKGTVKGFRKGNRWYYYYRKDKSDYEGTYITKKNISLAQSLAQKRYYQNALIAAQNELKQLTDFTKTYNSSSLENVYNSMPEAIKALVTPFELSDEEYIKKWLSQDFKPKGFKEDAPEHYADNDLRVRSKSEMSIANMLLKYNVPFLYEKPLYLKKYGIVHPDFTILDVKNRREIYYEHLGRLDAKEYINDNVGRLQAYIKNDYLIGERLLITFETYSQPLNIHIVKKTIEKYIPSGNDH